MSAKLIPVTVRPAKRFAPQQKLQNLSHLKISCYLRTKAICVSAISYYRVLKGLGWVSATSGLREAPYNTPLHEPFGPNQI